MSSVIQMPTGGGGLAARIAENVRVECARKGWVQADIARALKTSRTSISARWMGARPWQFDDLEQVAAALGIPAQRLLIVARPEGLEPPTFWSVVRQRLAATFGDRAGHRGAASGPVAPVYSIETGQRVA